MSTPVINVQAILNLIGDFSGSVEDEDSLFTKFSYYALRFNIKANGKLARYIKIVRVQGTMLDRKFRPVALQQHHWLALRKPTCRNFHQLQNVNDYLDIPSQDF